MGVGDVCENGSPGLASSSTTPSEPKEDGHVILIPHSHIFALMLQALKLPPANYHHKTYPGNNSRVTVTFNSSLQLIDGLRVQTSISGVISNNYDEAEDSAAIAAIRFYGECMWQGNQGLSLHPRTKAGKSSHTPRAVP
eukprot:UN00392